MTLTEELLTEEPMQSIDDRCPFLVPVVADRLFLYPTTAYCRRPTGQIRVPAAQTIADICESHYGECPGYRASAGTLRPGASVERRHEARGRAALLRSPQQADFV